MFNFRNTPTQVHLPDEWLERLDATHKHLVALDYQNTELKRTMVRIETKLTRLGIAAGYPDAVSRNA